MTDEARKIRLLMELRRAGINDTDVLSAIERVPRDLFVPDAFRDRAYEDTALPIACGQTISQPYVVAFMTAALQLTRRMLVLEIGTGSGYQTAVLSPLVRRVYTIERQRDLMIESSAKFKQLRLTNVVTRFGDGFKGWPEVAPFDRIIVTAAARDMPQNLVNQLSDGGMMIIPVGPSGNQTIMKVTRRGDAIDTAPLMPTRFVPMLGGTEG
ncbi:protein-L-isoaspartate(D-aspartate) O-methyltransferase [Iodidimonas sp. SYSU 1G8]|uniref:protein-L-isoaspartate(D-aspartate) O-methyltransferase n=1 Tax=Iodidimonas sp. SYSU 1G8 TaxID=3133967 RepID=UPI0031FF25F9